LLHHRHFPVQVRLLRHSSRKRWLLTSYTFPTNTTFRATSRLLESFFRSATKLYQPRHITTHRRNHKHTHRFPCRSSLHSNSLVTSNASPSDDNNYSIICMRFRILWRRNCPYILYVPSYQNVGPSMGLVSSMDDQCRRTLYRRGKSRPRSVIKLR
jgi:hypothetical protein